MSTRRLVNALNTVIAKNTSSFEVKVHTVNIFSKEEICDSLKLDYEDVSFDSAIFKWSYDMEVRKYGIKSILAEVPDQAIILTGSYLDTKKDQYVDFEKKLKITNVKQEYTYRESIRGLELFPIELKEYKGAWSVVFQI